MEGENQENSPPAMTAAEYAESVREWRDQMYHMTMFWSLLPFYEHERQLKAAGVWPISDTPRSIPSLESARIENAFEERVDTSIPPTIRGTEYGIPPLWKRLGAEVVDFMILLVIKFFITYVAIDQFGLIDLEDLADFTEVAYREPALMKASLKVAMEVTSEVVILETVHRLSVCVYEAFCTRAGEHGIIGGATPGKRMLGLRVVSCEWVAPFAEDRALVFPARNLGFVRAFARAVMKSFSLAFFLPITFSLFYMQHNRTAYDHLAGSIVVQPADDPHDMLPFFASRIPRRYRNWPVIRRFF